MVITRRRVLAGLGGLTASGLITGPALAQAAASNPPLFVIPHPDDEILGMCVPIAEHVRAGQDVHVLWLTRGEASGVRGIINGTSSAIAAWWGLNHDPAVEGYPALGVEEFGRARIQESTNAVRMLATGYPGTLTLHEAGLYDGTLTQESVQAAILAVADSIAPGGAVRLKTYSYLVDDHADHHAAGLAARALAAADPARFADVRYYVLPKYWSDSRLSQVTETYDTPADAGVATRCKLACRAFQAWSPPHTFAIGYHSVRDMFALIDTNPRSMVHP